MREWLPKFKMHDVHLRPYTFLPWNYSEMHRGVFKGSKEDSCGQKVRKDLLKPQIVTNQVQLWYFDRRVPCDLNLTLLTKNHNLVNDHCNNFSKIELTRVHFCIAEKNIAKIRTSPKIYKDNKYPQNQCHGDANTKNGCAVIQY